MQPGSCKIAEFIEHDPSLYLGCGDSQGVGGGVEQEGEEVIGAGVRDIFEDGTKVGSRGNKVGP